MPDRDTTSRVACPVCASERTAVFWEARNLPVLCNALCPTRDVALGVPRGDIVLALCSDCGFIFNQAFDLQRMEYTASYENSLHFSPRFQEYARALADGLVRRHDLQDKLVVEIACGHGDFLRELCRAGNNRGLGFDPSHVAAEEPCGAGITFVQDVFGEHSIDGAVDFVCCRHGLEHIADPLPFVRMVRRSLGDRTEVAVYFEVPNMLCTLREMGIWDLIYEHCAYFVPASLRALFVRGGFEILEITEAFDGQYLGLEARPSLETAAPDCEPPGESLEEDVRRFAESYERKLGDWRTRLDDMRRQQRKAVIWGGGSKGVTFLNVLQANEQVEYVVDINPRKEGMHVPGTGQRIVMPTFLRDCAPDCIIVMNPVYLDEIRSAVGEMGLSPEFLVA